MSGRAPRSQGFSGTRLYVAVGAWLMLILVGGFCTWYGWLGSNRGAQTPPTETVEAASTDTAPTSVVNVDTPSSQEPEPVNTDAPPHPTATDTQEVFGYGIVIHGAGGGNVDYMMGQVENLGLGWVKQQLRWADVERNPGEMEWGPYDWVVEAAGERGIKVMFSIVDAPSWLRSSYLDENVEGAPPDNLADYANFLGLVVDRYNGRIHAIEVWNEQNLDREWQTGSGLVPAQYVEFLSGAYETIKAHNSDIIVISGALSPTGVHDGITVYDDFLYMDGLLEAGLLDYTDCVGAHHNGYNIGPDVAFDQTGSAPDAATASFRGPFDNPHHSWSFKTTLDTYAEKVRAIDPEMKLCITEFGWASSEGYDAPPEGFGFAADNTLEEQATYIVDAYQQMRESGYVWLTFLFNFDYGNKSGGPSNDNVPYSIIDVNGVPRPAFGAISAMEKTP